MPIPQGDLALLETNTAVELLASRIPARLAYTGADDTPRVMPIYFHWTGKELVFGSSPNAPHVKALSKRPAGAVTIDTEGFPPRVLMLRGAVTVEVQDGLVAEYAAAAKRYMGDEAGEAWVAGIVEQPMARLALRPSWVATFDFDKRFPSGAGGILE